MSKLLVNEEPTIKANYIYKIKKVLHKKFDNKRVDGEWFLLSNDDVDFIKSFDTLNYNSLEEVISHGI